MEWDAPLPPFTFNALNKSRAGKHFELEMAMTHGVPEEQLASPEVVGFCKVLSALERAFRCRKTGSEAAAHLQRLPDRVPARKVSLGNGVRHLLYENLLGI